MRLAIDAMGNDRGAPPIVDGVAAFLRGDPETAVVLVGDERVLTDLLAGHGLAPAPDRLEIVHASQVMEMEDKVADLRGKRDSSIFKLVDLAREGRADAVIALGNTAAAVGAATMRLGRLAGVRRPGIAIPFPTRTGSPCVAIDMGANTAAVPEDLVTYGVMASVYAKRMFGVAEPRVGLLNVGEERGKGNDDLRRAFELLEQAPVKFVGNVEGRDLFSGACDVLVCDGFIGNVTLKAVEGLASLLTGWMKEAFLSSFPAKIGGLLARRALKEKVAGRVDYSQYGGMPLLGVDGLCLIGHGRSDATAVASALRAAKTAAKQNLNAVIRDELKTISFAPETRAQA